ncbi:hypothetical protein KIMC2_00590 [Xylocopilactobacillus apis]|uniref:Uncharacterized protein n=1 Tax=Xylocopilactobacillus apis TaxID=2932183 RepID=A0AAU9DFM0_9LACO|nr:hypothetical protein KIMC2_00590 [Xylocopilactobacillus apis]
MSQTQTIMDGMSVQGVPISDVLTIVNLKKAWQFFTESKEILDLNFEKKVNAIVAMEDALIPGELRSGQGGVDLGNGENFKPPKVNEKAEIEFLNQLLNSNCSAADQALTLMYHNMRNQCFGTGIRELQC